MKCKCNLQNPTIHRVGRSKPFFSLIFYFKGIKYRENFSTLEHAQRFLKDVKFIALLLIWYEKVLEKRPDQKKTVAFTNPQFRLFITWISTTGAVFIRAGSMKEARKILEVRARHKAHGELREILFDEDGFTEIFTTF